MLAMLLSAFENILYLDADCFPIYNPDILFSKPPFTTHGLVL
jgi:alpha 1,2-mannosyltransferase